MPSTHQRHLLGLEPSKFANRSSTCEESSLPPPFFLKNGADEWGHCAYRPLYGASALQRPLCIQCKDGTLPHHNVNCSNTHIHTQATTSNYAQERGNFRTIGIKQITRPTDICKRFHKFTAFIILTPTCRWVLTSLPAALVMSLDHNKG